MQPEDPNQDPVQIDNELTPQENVPPTPPAPEIIPASKSRKKPLTIISVVLLLLLSGCLVYWFEIKPDSETSQESVKQVQPADEEPKTNIPEGFVEYKDETENISFIYPKAWGDVTVEPGLEEAMKGHVVAGSERILKFSGNTSVQAGVKSTNWLHHQDLGHDGRSYPGEISLDTAKSALEYVEPSQVYANTDSQFAYVEVCSEFCAEAQPYAQLYYTFTLKGNDKYKTLQFFQKGDIVPDKYFATDFPEKRYDTLIKEVDTETLLSLLPKTDKRFTDIQVIADYATSNQ